MFAQLWHQVRCSNKVEDDLFNRLIVYSFWSYLLMKTLREYWKLWLMRSSTCRLAYGLTSTTFLDLLLCISHIRSSNIVVDILYNLCVFKCVSTEHCSLASMIITAATWSRFLLPQNTLYEQRLRTLDHRLLKLRVPLRVCLSLTFPTSWNWGSDGDFLFWPAYMTNFGRDCWHCSEKLA